MNKIAKVSFNFNGLMAPVFTSFNNDTVKSVNVNNIGSYAEFLKKKSINGVLVNGTSGEGPVMSLAERKTVAEAWSVACKKYQLTLMVQIGGGPLKNVLELAEHAESLNVDAILCLPELYFKPKTLADLVAYMKEVGQHCDKTPLLYYHIPRFTELGLNMPSFCDMAEKEIPNFVGLKYSSGDLVEGAECLRNGRSVFLGAETVLSAALLLGFDSAIMTVLNICPELAIEIRQCIESGDLKKAASAQTKLSIKLKEIMAAGGGRITSMKLAFNNMQTPGLNVGPARFPSRI